MKFAQLPVGLRFLYKAHAYTKVSNLMARPEGDGSDRLIPRSANITPLDEPPVDLSERPSEVAIGELDRAMMQLAGEVNDIVAASGLDATEISRLSQALQQAFTRARASLHLDP